VLARDLRTLASLARGQPRRGTHAERLQAFYAPQAADYDRFRERLLAGRRELIEQLPARPGSLVVEFGAGTGRNAEHFGARLAALGRLELVDLCPALLERARARAAAWPNVAVVEADAARYRPARPADCVYFSYSLTMMQDWRSALDNAVALLRPGGVLGVVDFHVSEAHGAWTRRFWPRWFAASGVRLSPEHLPWLRARLHTLAVSEGRTRVPYLAGMRVPYYRYLGRKPAAQPQ
jgi:S-adenosylmethionine-diacylgycerolhomoserine-N-methlytransferase